MNKMEQIKNLIERIKLNQSDNDIEELITKYSITDIVESTSEKDFEELVPILGAYSDKKSENSSETLDKTLEVYDELLNSPGFEFLTDEEKEEVRKLGENIHDLSIRKMKLSGKIESFNKKIEKK